MSSDSYTVTGPDGSSVDLPQVQGTMGPPAVDVRKLYANTGGFTFDPGFTSTCSCESGITFIDGEKGQLLYRGYRADELAQKSNYMEVCYLLLNGELPTQSEYEEFNDAIRMHTMLNESLKRFFTGFHYDAHPMAMLSSIVSGLSAFYHDTTNTADPEHRKIFARRMIAKIPTIAAAAYKYSIGQPMVYPKNDLDYSSNFLHMMFAVPAEDYEVDPVAAEALDVLLILHADHEQNASTSTVRLAGSTGCNPYAAISSGIAACARRRQRGGAQAAFGDRQRRQCRQVHCQGQGQERPVPSDGLRPSRLQELRSTCDRHPRALPQGPQGLRR